MYQGVHKYSNMKSGSRKKDLSYSNEFSTEGSSPFKNENQKIKLQNQLNSLSSSIEKMSMLTTQSRKFPIKRKIRSSKNKTLYHKKRLTRKKRDNKPRSRRSRDTQYRFLIKKIKQMNRNSTNKQNAIIYLSRSILNDPVLSINNKNELMQQFES